MTYTLLIYRTLPLASALPAQRERTALAGHRAVQAEAAAKADLHAVAQLAAPKTARIVRPRAGAHEVTDGPFAETKEWLVGFYLVDCENEDQAIARARRLCPDDSHFVEVRPVVWRWKH